MKLYATTTSERGKPATKGGNDFIKVDFQVEHRDGTREKIPSIWLHEWESLEGKKSFIVSISDGRELKEIYEIKVKA
jgi:hypothetical protein